MRIDVRIDDALNWATGDQTSRWRLVLATECPADRERDTWDTMNETALAVLATEVQRLRGELAEVTWAWDTMRREALRLVEERDGAREDARYNRMRGGA